MSTSFLRNIMVGCLPLLLCILISCSKEASLTPDEIPDFYTLPQGHQPYDDSIVAFHQQYGSYILYQFSQKDLTYNYNSYLPMTFGPANPAWISNAISYFKSECLNYYPESFLQKTMPFKILLAAYFDSSYSYGSVLIPIGRALTGFSAVRGALGIGWADSTLSQQSPTRLKQLRGFVHRAYMQQALLSGALEVPDEFRKYLPVGGGYNNPGNATNGLIEGNPLGATNRDVAWDFSSYVCAITGNTKAELDATILKPSYDTQGLIRAKYAIVINFFKNNYGVDLQAIGNHP
ncbi:hypothetical protein [Chitinophaga sp.]|uniref:hypothetical protein n=1 Tax=Chitinophaga sp. TaxID=1869181 RepID=UPI002F95CC25